MSKLNTISGFLRVVKVLVLLGGCVALTIMFFLEGDYTKVNLGDPYVYLKDDQSEALEKLNSQLTGLIETDQDVTFNVNRLEMRIPASSGFKVFVSFLIVFAVAYTFYLVDLIQKIIQDIKTLEPFKKHNTDRIKRIGLLVMLIPIAEWVAAHAFEFWLSLNFSLKSSDPHLRIGFASESSYGWAVFILGLLIYTLGFAFSQGEKLQEENELTI